MKKVLMISNPFLPATTSGVRRSVGFIRYLRDYGWEPVVLTREISDTENTRVSPDFDIPNGIDIYRTNPWELDELPGLLGITGRRLGELLLAPDKERLWEIFSRRKAAKIVKYDGIDLIFTASAPKSSHLLGLYLKKRFPQIPWIADMRAELPGDMAGSKASNSTFKTGAEKRADIRIFEKADCITTDNEDMLKAILKSIEAKGSDERCFMIPDGYAQELSEVFEKACRLIASKRLEQ